MKRTAIGFLKDTYGKNKTLFEITDSMKPHDVAKAMEDYAAEVVKNVSNPVNCAICRNELTDSEKEGGGNCCDLCWLSN